MESSFKVITTNTIGFKFIHKDAKMPKQADEGSSGYDLYSVERMEITPGQILKVPTGLIWEPQVSGIEMQVRPRSGLAAKHGITVLNAPGTVDNSYRGEICVILINHGKEPYVIEVGERIAQAVFARYENFDFVLVDTVGETKRKGGFGITGQF